LVTDDAASEPPDAAMASELRPTAISSASATVRRSRRLKEDPPFEPKNLCGREESFQTH
jgi:hypothetical protein